MYQRSLPRDDPNQCIKVCNAIKKEEPDLIGSTNITNNKTIDDLYSKPDKNKRKSETIENELYSSCLNKEESISYEDIRLTKKEEKHESKSLTEPESNIYEVPSVVKDKDESETVENDLYQKACLTKKISSSSKDITVKIPKLQETKSLIDLESGYETPPICIDKKEKSETIENDLYERREVKRVNSGSILMKICSDFIQSERGHKIDEEDAEYAMPEDVIQHSTVLTLRR